MKLTRLWKPDRIHISCRYSSEECLSILKAACAPDADVMSWQPGLKNRARLYGPDKEVGGVVELTRLLLQGSRNSSPNPIFQGRITLGEKRPQTCKKRRRLYPGSAERRRATRPNEVWAIDFQFDETSDYRRLKLTNIVDEFTREALAMEVNRSSGADDLVTVIERLIAERGAPEFLRMDNGPELVAWAVRDWCRLSGTRTLYIEPGSPWQNAYVESFNGRVHDELLNIEEFGSLIEARVLVESWRMEYNTYRPHSSLGGLTPAEFTRRWAEQHQPACS